MVTFDYKFSGVNITVFKCESLSEVSSLLNERKQNGQILIESCSNKYGTFDYKLEVYSAITNPDVRISFMTSETEKTTIHVPVKLMCEYLDKGSRKVSTSEYHYFPGVSATKINKMSIPRYTWKDSKHVVMGGSYDYLIDEVIMNQIINELKVC